MKLTPLQWTMLLHYHAIAEPYAMRDPNHANSIAVQEQRAELIQLGLIEPISSLEWPSGFRKTDKGRCLIEFICNDIPSPVSVTEWRIPI